MKLVSLKLDPEKRKELSQPIADDRLFPYGTELTIENEKIKELGLESATKNQKVRLFAVGEVVSVSSHDSQHGTHSTVNIQIQELAVEMDTDTDRKEKYAAMFKD